MKNRFVAPVLSPRTLAQRLRKKRRGKTTVFTNGCFDLVHAGHLAVLSKARGLGDLLVVALNTDASVRRLKGPPRPLLSLSERAHLLAGLRCVDYVTYFGEDTPERIIRLLKPDILAKGGDWAPQHIVGRKMVKKVVRIPLVKNKSTTAIIQRVLRGHGKKKRKGLS